MEREREEMRQKLETEINELQTNVKRLQKMETVLAEGNQKSQKLTEMRQKLQELMEENRRLKGSLTDAQTSTAMVNAELAKLRLDYDEKYQDLLTEKETLIAAIEEQNSMSYQVQLL